MLAGTYEIHHDKEDVDITPGDRFSLDWGLSATANGRLKMIPAQT